MEFKCLSNGENNNNTACPKEDSEDCFLQQYKSLMEKLKGDDRVIQNCFPIPRIEDIYDRLQGSSHFSIIDLKSGYH